MDVKETTRIVRIIAATYPNYTLAKDSEATADAVDLWQAVLAEYPFEVVSGALRSYIKNDRKGFPPVPGQLIEIIENAIYPDAMNEEEAWDLVTKAGANGYYNSQAEFDKLPEIIQQTIRSPHYLYNFSLTPYDDLGVLKSHFLRSYREEVKKRKNIDNLPKGIMPTIEKMRADSETKKIEAAAENPNVPQIEEKPDYEYAVRMARERLLAENTFMFNESDSMKGSGIADMLRQRLGVDEEG